MPQLKNQKHEDFIREYRVDKNAKQAAIRAGYSKRTAASQGSRLLNNVNIQKRYVELLEADAERNDLTLDQILQEYKKLAFQPVDHPSIKASDKRAALHDLGRHIGMFDDDRNKTNSPDRMVVFIEKLSQCARPFPIATQRALGDEIEHKYRM